MHPSVLVLINQLVTDFPADNDNLLNIRLEKAPKPKDLQINLIFQQRYHTILPLWPTDGLSEGLSLAPDLCTPTIFELMETLTNHMRLRD